MAGLLRIGAWQYTLISLASRFAWALTALYLVAVMPTAEYGAYSFIQISTGLISQVLLGVLPNVISSRLAALEPANRARLLLLAIGYGATVIGIAAMVAVLADFATLTSFGPRTIAIGLFWIFAGYVAVLQLGYLLAGGQYGRSAWVSLLQPAIYVALLTGWPVASGETVAFYAGVATLLPSLLAMLLYLRPTSEAEPASVATKALLGDHRQALAMNLATIPSSVLLLLMVNAIAATGDHTQLAVYGIANQCIGLFFNLPATLGGMAIPRLTRADKAGRRRIVTLTATALIALSLLCAGAFVLVVELPVLPRLLGEGKWEVAVAFLVAGFATGRSPLAWVNQIGRHSRIESLSLLLNALVLCAIVVVPASSMAALLVRLAAAMASLAFSMLAFLGMRRN